jgi:hypothetical protein
LPFRRRSLVESCFPQGELQVVAAKLDALAVVATGDDNRIEAERQRQQQLVAESAKQLAMLAEKERQLPRTVRRDDDDEDDDDDDDEDDGVRHDRVSTLAAAQWKSLVASRTTARAGHAAATASLQVLSQFSGKATGLGGDSGCSGGGGREGGGLGPLTRPPQHQQHRDQMLKRVEALRQEALSAQASFHEEHRRLEVALKEVVEQQQLHELGTSPTSLMPLVRLLRPRIKHNAVVPVVVRDANAGAKQRRPANSDINSDVGSSSNQPHTDQEDAAPMTDVSAPRDQALELHSSEATTMRNLASDSSSSTIGDDGGADPSMTAVTPTVGHRLGRRAPRRVVRRIVPKSAATTGQQQRRSVLNDRRRVTSSPSATGSDNAAALAAEALGALEAARQQTKAADAKARVAKARKALSPEYMRKAAAAMFEKAFVAQQNATQASRDEARAPSPIVS